MRKSKISPEPTPCSFCHAPIDASHVVADCPTGCGGKVHYVSGKGDCTCCGRTFEQPAEPQPE
jgi:hypothetical protein